MKVMKFGGSSVGGAEQIKNTCKLIAERAKPSDVIIESAIGTDEKKGEMVKVTDMLIQLYNAELGERDKLIDKIITRHYRIMEDLGLDVNKLGPEFNELEGCIDIPERSAKNLDLFQSFGERLSVKIVAAQLRKIGVNASAIGAHHAGLVTTSDFGHAIPLPDVYDSIQKALKNAQEITIITGFIGCDSEGNITTLGRGGSDYSAAIFAAALNAERLELWTDVNGIKSANPKIVPWARTIKRMSFEEAKELSFYGAKLHPKTILPAMENNIPVYILNTFDPDGEYTIITNDKEVHPEVVKGITCDKKNYIININTPKMIGQPGFLARVLDAFEINATDIDMVSTSESSASLTINDAKLIDAIIDELKYLDPKISIKVEEGKSIICVVGEGMKHKPGTSGRLFSALGKAGISVEAISQGASEINITFVVKDDDADNAVRAIHDEFFGQDDEEMDGNGIIKIKS